MIRIQIRANRGSTVYEYEAHYASETANAQVEAERNAASFERWLADQPDRQAKNDQQSNMRSK